VSFSFFTDNLEAFHAKALAASVPVASPPTKYTDPNGLEFSVTEHKEAGGINMQYAILFTDDADGAQKLYEELYGFHEPIRHDAAWRELRLDNDRRHTSLAIHKGGCPAADGGVDDGAGSVQLGFFVRKLDDFHTNAVKHKLTVIEAPAKQPWGGYKGTYQDQYGVVHSVVEADFSKFDPHAEHAAGSQAAYLCGHIEIPVRNMDRAKKFYEDAFGFNCQSTMPGYTIFRAPKDPSMPEMQMGGGLDLVASDDLLLKYHVVCFITNDIEPAVKKMLAAGGKLVKPTWLINEHVGWQCLWEDSEGNQHSFFKSARGK